MASRVRPSLLLASSAPSANREVRAGQRLRRPCVTLPCRLRSARVADSALWRAVQLNERQGELGCGSHKRCRILTERA